MSESLLTADCLTFRYAEEQVIHGISLRAEPGRITGIIGINGSGKTTLLKLLCGLLQPISGGVCWGGRDAAGMSRREIARCAAFVPQEPPASSAFTVRDVAAMGRNPYLDRFCGEREVDRRAIDEALKLSDMEHFAGRRLSQLSNGEQKRVFIARALAQQTRTIILDEPLANLDLAHQLALLALLRRLALEGRVILLSMHDLSLAATHCSELLLLQAGRLAASGPPKKVITQENLLQFFGVRASILQLDSATAVVPLGSEYFDKT